MVDLDLHKRLVRARLIRILFDEGYVPYENKYIKFIKEFIVCLLEG